MKIQNVIGAVCLLSLCATPWVITPAVVSSVVFTVVYAIERYVLEKNTEMKLAKTEAAMAEVYRLRNVLADHADKIGQLSLRLK
jgi:hypothetical protein